MKVGLAFASSVDIDGAQALELCKAVVDYGFETIWVGEYVVLPDSIHSNYPYS